MALSWHFAEPDTFVLVARGRLTLDEVRRVHAEVLADPRMVPGVRILADNREMQGAFSAGELRTIARDMVPFSERGIETIAIVCTSTLHYGVARMFSAFAEPFNLHVGVFRDYGEAEQWLGLTPTLEQR